MAIQEFFKILVELTWNDPLGPYFNNNLWKKSQFIERCDILHYATIYYRTLYIVTVCLDLSYYEY